MQNENFKFKNKVFEIVKQIPLGSVSTYKEVAAKAGSLNACRAVGNILNKNYNPEIFCHRVIKSNGEIGGYNRGKIKKRELLEQERYL